MRISKENKDQQIRGSALNIAAKNQSNNNFSYRFEDRRPEAGMQRNLQVIANQHTERNQADQILPPQKKDSIKNGTTTQSLTPSPNRNVSTGVQKMISNSRATSIQPYRDYENLPATADYGWGKMAKRGTTDKDNWHISVEKSVLSDKVWKNLHVTWETYKEQALQGNRRHHAYLEDKAGEIQPALSGRFTNQNKNFLSDHKSGDATALDKRSATIGKEWQEEIETKFPYFSGTEVGQWTTWGETKKIKVDYTKNSSKKYTPTEKNKFDNYSDDFSVKPSTTNIAKGNKVITVTLEFDTAQKARTAFYNIKDWGAKWIGESKYSYNVSKL